MQSFFKQEQEAYSLLWGMVARWNGPTEGTFHSQGKEEGVTLPAHGLEGTPVSALKALDRVSLKHEESGWECQSRFTVEVDISQILGE